MADLFGSDLGDHITGTNADDFIVTLFRNSVVHARGGNDEIFGARGTDYLWGDDGNDVINGGDGDDVIYGGRGHDGIEGYQADDRIFGNQGNDFLSGNWGNDYLSGGPGADSLAGAGGRDRLFGGTGDDELSGDNGKDYLSGGAGNDTLLGGPGADVLLGGDGDDFLWAGSEGDLVKAGAGDDVMILGIGPCTLKGGTGSDTATFQGTDGVSMDFVRPVAEGGVKLKGVEILDFTANGGIRITLNADTVAANSLPDQPLLIRSGGDDATLVMTDSGWERSIDPDGTLRFTHGDATVLVEGQIDLYQTLAISGTDGDDVFSAGDRYFFVGDGGAGTDTIAVTGSGVLLDLSLDTASSVAGIEVFDLGGDGNNLLIFSTDVLAGITDQVDAFVADGSRQVLIQGDADDSVTCLDGGWIAGSQVQIGDQFYTAYTNPATDLQLFIDSDISTLVG